MKVYHTVALPPELQKVVDEIKEKFLESGYFIVSVAPDFSSITLGIEVPEVENKLPSEKPSLLLD